MTNTHKLINFILFMLLWPVAVVGAVNDTGFWTVLLWITLCAHTLWVLERRDLTLVLAKSTLVFGWCFEFMMVYLGLVEYKSSYSLMGVPIWILCLWHGLGMTFRMSNLWLINSHRWYVISWLLLVPVTYMSASGLGAIDIVDPLSSCFAIIFFWGLMIASVRVLFKQLLVDSMNQQGAQT